ncbi:epimerase family protein SDR39U1 [Amblyraja radiata]|uniref:epimerase family protein SDR39U1 n=1 Tax=Amblyraja radiata TaxID=386614 RepID=UPI001401D77F|nr:epimerase family protein SDR39U1 [Amblyraja radiata]
MKVLIGGGSGFVGSALSRLLRSKGHEVEFVSRRPGAGVTWTHVASRGLPPCDAVVNVAGANILNPLRRWSRSFQQEVVLSRVETTRTLSKAISLCPHPPRSWVLLTGVGYYQPSLREEYHEGSVGGDFDFFSRLVGDWESAARLPEGIGRLVRQVVVRAGVVLGREGGALPPMLLPFRMGLGGPLGSGLQPFPWIHVEDLAGILLHALEGGGRRLGEVEGVLNGVAPSRCTQGEFAEALAGSLGRGARLRVPAALVQAALGSERALLLLQGQWVEPRRTLASGYRYRFPRLQAAIDNLLH